MRRSVALVAILLFGFSYGIVAGHFRLFPYPELLDLGRTLFRPDLRSDADPPIGRWYLRQGRSDSDAAGKLEELASVGYLGGYSPASNEAGVLTFDASRTQPGLTLFSSGHTAGVFLINESGDLVHEWKIEFEDLWPQKLPFSTEEEHKQFIRRAHLFSTGDLLVVFEYIGIVRLDKDSNVVWKRLGQNHHDFSVSADGSVVTLERQKVPAAEMKKTYPGVDAPHGIFDDHLVFLNSAGVELKRLSLFNALYTSEYAPFLGRSAFETRDVMHANSVDPIENANGESRAAITNGEVLVSMRNLNAIVSVDPEEGVVTWMLTGKWKQQHQAQLLDSGAILLLDNLGGNARSPSGQPESRVLEIDPWTQQTVWSYEGSDESPFFTHWLGYVQRLPNGNTLVTESTQGRIFEVTREGHLVWEYLSPHRIGTDETGELIATIMGARRIDEKSLTFLRESGVPGPREPEELPALTEPR